MQGFQAMLRAMGVDVEQIRGQIETVVGSATKAISDRFEQTERKFSDDLAKIENRLSAIEMELVQLSAKFLPQNAKEQLATYENKETAPHGVEDTQHE